MPTRFKFFAINLLSKGSFNELSFNDVATIYKTQTPITNLLLKGAASSK